MSPASGSGLVLRIDPHETVVALCHRFAEGSSLAAPLPGATHVWKGMVATHMSNRTQRWTRAAALELCAAVALAPLGSAGASKTKKHPHGHSHTKKHGHASAHPSGSSSAVATYYAQPCLLVTQSQVEAAIGEPTRPGVSSKDTAYSSYEGPGCTFSTNDASGTSVYVIFSDGNAQQDEEEALQFSTKGITKESGFGVGAFCQFGGGGGLEFTVPTPPGKGKSMILAIDIYPVASNAVSCPKEVVLGKDALKTLS